VLISFVFSVYPGGIHWPILRWSDKLDHGVVFMTAGFLLRMGWNLSYVSAFGLLAFYGVFIEFVQIFTAGHTADWLDFAADISGLLFGLFLTYFARKRCG
jgi:VanZ family protein